MKSLTLILLLTLPACTRTSPSLTTAPPDGGPARSQSTIAEELTRLSPTLDLLDGAEVVNEGCDALKKGTVTYLGEDDLQFLKANRGAVQPTLERRISEGHHGTAYVLAAIGAKDLTGTLARRLLASRHFYGWEGSDPDRASTYLHDAQYPHQIAYLCAIEHLHGRKLNEVVQPTAEELEALKRDEKGLTDPAKPGTPTSAFAARWMLGKLGVTPTSKQAP